MSSARPSRFPAVLVLVWIASIAVWWALAFMPLPSAAPEWLTTARYACFGPMENGLPESYGWILLVLAPASSLAAIFVLWGAEVGPSLRDLARSPLGGGLLVVVVGVLLLESTWVVRKVHAARAISAATQADDDGALPAHYPRAITVAPDFALVDQHGALVSLASFRGRPVVVTFVFGHCPTMCPLIVATLKRVPSDDGAPDVLLVSLDPWRDTPNSLPGIARQWQLPSHFHLLSARQPAEVLAVADRFGVPHERDEKTGDITHPGLVFVVDPGGRLAYTFNNPSAAWVREALVRAATHAPRG